MRKNESLQKVDRIIHEPARLMIATILRFTEEADFRFLLSETGLTNGNLVSHLRKMEDAGYIDVEKGFQGRRPHTTYRMTPLGAERYDRHRKTLKSIMNPSKR